MNEFEKERIILVFDLGGGTFDVSIVKVKNKNFEILASCGDDHLGGQDFTERLTDYVIECFKSDEDIDESINFKDKNNRDLFKSYLKLKNKIEDYKNQLSFLESVDIVYEDNFYNNKSISMNLLRTNYEEVCQDLFERCLDKIKGKERNKAFYELEDYDSSKITEDYLISLKQILKNNKSDKIEITKEIINEYYLINDKWIESAINKKDNEIKKDFN